MVVVDRMRWGLQKKLEIRVIFMDEGYIIEENIPSEIFNNPQQERTKSLFE